MSEYKYGQYSGSKMARIGYARVSTTQQDLSEQINALEKYGCTKIFSGKHSGKAESNQQQLDALLEYVREDDVVVVTKLDRLGRSLTQCLKALDWFKQYNVGFVAIQQGIDTTKKDDPMAMAMIHLLGLFAELERNFIVDRTQSGKQLKLVSGDKNALGGRPRKLPEEVEKRLLQELQRGISINDAVAKFGVSRATVSRYKKQI